MIIKYNLNILRRLFIKQLENPNLELSEKEIMYIKHKIKYIYEPGSEFMLFKQVIYKDFFLLVVYDFFCYLSSVPKF